MNVQVLIATMNRQDHALLDQMNIQTDAIVGNQCDRNEIERFQYRGRTVEWLSFSERGVGLNRNNTLMRATGDILLFADDDVVYLDGYEKTIQQFYAAHPDADVVIFNFRKRRNGGEFRNIVKKTGRVGRKSVTGFGTYCITARRDPLFFANVFFHLQFGGGARYSCGEDSIFLQDCIRNKLRVYTCKETIGVLDHGASTWFSGYDDKFFFDKGVLFFRIAPFTSRILALYHCRKHRREYAAYGWVRAYRQMCKGITFKKGNQR